MSRLSEEIPVSVSKFRKASAAGFKVDSELQSAISLVMTKIAHLDVKILVCLERVKQVSKRFSTVHHHLASSLGA